MLVREGDLIGALERQLLLYSMQPGQGGALCGSNILFWTNIVDSFGTYSIGGKHRLLEMRHTFENTCKGFTIDNYQVMALKLKNTEHQYIIDALAYSTNSDYNTTYFKISQDLPRSHKIY